MIRLTDLTISNRGSRTLLHRQSLAIAPGTLTALVGRNGCGKSTLLRVMCGVQKPDGGSVAVNGLDVARTSPRRLAQTVAVVTTEPVRVPNLTCAELVGLGRAPHTGFFARLGADDRLAVDRALEAVGMTDFARRQVSEISDGESRRIMLARALAQDTPVILLDEPTSFLDVPGRYEIGALLGRLCRRQGKTIVYSTHELEPAMRCADAMLLMHPGGLLMLPPAEMAVRPEFVSSMTPDLRE